VPKILLVDDNEMNRDALCRRLLRRGFEVSVAGDGAEGLERAQTEGPDLILMDLGLPQIDGLEVTRRLKSSEATKQIPVIALTAHATRDDMDRALAAGCDDFDTKPVDFTRLLHKISGLIPGLSPE
jgi:CheY-like chemotaxis protein